jgi:uncharacterized membrane protein
MPINLLTWLHLIAMAFFVGGQLVLAVAIVPVLRGVNDGEPMRAVARRFGYGTLVALGVLLVTGMAMAIRLKLGSAWQLHAKMGLFVLLGVLILIHMKKPKLHALDALIFIGSLVAVWLGVSLAN